MSNHLTCKDHKRRSLILKNSQIHRDGTSCDSDYFIIGINYYTAEIIRLSRFPLGTKSIYFPLIEDQAAGRRSS